MPLTVRLLAVALLAWLAGGLFLAACAPEATPTAPARPVPGEPGRPVTGQPNVLWILLDACRAQNLGAYGHHRATSPHIDRLAAGGTLFEQHYAQAGYTTLSVPSYMAARYFPVHSLNNGLWRTLWKEAGEGEEMAPEIFSAHGYATAIYSAHPWMSRDARLTRAFDAGGYVRPPEGHPYPAFEILGKAFLEWIDTTEDTPFFAYLHAMDTHWPHFLTPPFDLWVNKPVHDPELMKRLPMDGYGAFDEADQQLMAALHDGSILYSDAVLGWILAELERRGLRENTIVVVHADHGEALGEDGRLAGHPSHLFADELLHVPFIIAGPGVPVGRRVTALTENVDILPTLTGLLGLETDFRHDGRSLEPLLTGDAPQDWRHFTFAKYAAAGMDDFGVVLRFTHVKYADNRHAPAYLNKQPEELWRVPDGLADRKDLGAEARGILADARAVLQTHITPLWDDYNARPLTNPAPFTMPLLPTDGSLDVEPAEAVNWAEDLPRDGKWSARHGTLKSWPTEDAPPVRVRVGVPNGTFRVQVSAVVPKRAETVVPGAGLIQVKAMDEVAFRTLPVPEDGVPGEASFVTVGDYAVTESRFDLWLDEAEPRHYTIPQQLRFIPLESGIAPGDVQVGDEDDALRALGYL